MSLQVENGKLPLRRFPAIEGKTTIENEYWRHFKSPILYKETSQIVSVHFCPTAPYQYAVATGARVQIYSSKTNECVKTITRFPDASRSARIRKEGKLMVASDDSGQIQLFNLSTRSILRTFKGHTASVKCVLFSPSNTHLLSVGDDKCLKRWDIGTNECVLSIEKAHDDFIRSAAFVGASGMQFITGGYDHRVHYWDLKLNDAAPLFTMDHGTPVEAVLVHKNGTIAVSAGGAKVMLWDLTNGGAPLHTIHAHQKAVTCMAFNESCSRLLTGSIDQSVKVHDLATFLTTHTFRYPSAVMSLALSPNDTHLVVGGHDGLLTIRKRTIKAADTVQKEQQKGKLRGGTYRFFLRGAAMTPEETTVVFTKKNKKPKLQPHEKFLKSFAYGKALDAAIESRSPVVITTLIEELITRDGLSIALKDRDEEELLPASQFLQRYIVHPRYSRHASLLLDMILDMYARVLPESTIICDTLQKVKRKVREEVHFKQDVTALLGAMDCLLTQTSTL